MDGRSSATLNLGETEEDVVLLLRCPQAQRTASEKKRDRRKVNQRFLTAMVEMGITVEKAEVALSETGNVGIEARLFSLADL